MYFNHLKKMEGNKKLTLNIPVDDLANSKCIGFINESNESKKTPNISLSNINKNYISLKKVYISNESNNYNDIISTYNYIINKIEILIYTVFLISEGLIVVNSKSPTLSLVINI